MEYFIVFLISSIAKCEKLPFNLPERGEELKYLMYHNDQIKCILTKRLLKYGATTLFFFQQLFILKRQLDTSNTHFSQMLLFSWQQQRRDVVHFMRDWLIANVNSSAETEVS